MSMLYTLHVSESGQIEFEEFCKLMLEQVNCQGDDRDETLLAAFKVSVSKSANSILFIWI